MPAPVAAARLGRIDTSRRPESRVVLSSVICSASIRLLGAAFNPPSLARQPLMNDNRRHRIRGSSRHFRKNLSRSPWASSAGLDPSSSRTRYGGWGTHYRLTAQHTAHTSRRRMAPRRGRWGRGSLHGGIQQERSRSRAPGGRRRRAPGHAWRCLGRRRCRTSHPRRPASTG